MPHYPKPFFRPSRGLWYVQVGGKQVNLGPDEAAAFTRYHELMAAPKGRTQPADLSAQSVVVLVNQFLDWCEKNRERRNYDWYRERCQSFCRSIHASLAVSELKPFHVQQWVDAKPDWATGMKRGAMLAVQRALNWAVKFGHLDRSPVARMEKPEAGKREFVITPELYRKILRHVPDQCFQDLLTLAWESGARPQELLAAEARHADLAAERLVFPQKEAKGKKRVRVIHLNAAALAIVRRLAAEHPEGKLLRNEDGVAWTRFAVNCRFCRLRLKVGVKLCLYNFRHSFCHRALKNGVDSVTLANLMGHVDTAMIARVYSHLAQDQQYLKDSLRRATA